jgi:hypothetical protein
LGRREKEKRKRDRDKEGLSEELIQHKERDRTSGQIEEEQRRDHRLSSFIQLQSLSILATEVNLDVSYLLSLPEVEDLAQTSARNLLSLYLPLSFVKDPRLVAFTSLTNAYDKRSK